MTEKQATCRKPKLRRELICSTGNSFIQKLKKKKIYSQLFTTCVSKTLGTRINPGEL